MLLGGKERTARKEHECSLCGHTIEVGSRYIAAFAVWDGVPTYTKEHIACGIAYREAADDVDLGHGDEWPTCLQEFLVEYRRELSQKTVDEIERLLSAEKFPPKEGGND